MKSSIWKFAKKVFQRNSEFKISGLAISEKKRYQNRDFDIVSGLTVASGDAMYSLSVNKGPFSSVLTIDLPEGKVVTASGGQKSGFLWEDLKE